MKKLLIIPFFFFTLSVFGQFTKPELYYGINQNIRLKSLTSLRVAAMLDSIVVSMGLGSGGSGYVVGPASATDNVFPLFDGTTGKLLKNSTFSSTDAANAITAYGWGNHASAGYMTLTGTQALTGNKIISGSGSGFNLSLGDTGSEIGNLIVAMSGAASFTSTAANSSSLSVGGNIGSLRNGARGYEVSPTGISIFANASQYLQGDATGFTWALGSDAPGDIYRRNSSGYFSRLALGTALQTLRVNAGGTDIEWAAPSGGGSGTVTSVSASVPSFLSISGSPITTSGTLAISLSGTALPVANGGTGITSLGTGVATALGANVSGSGGIAMTNSPTFTGTPIFPSTFTVGANSFTRGGAHGLTLTTTGTTNVTLPTTGTLATLSNNTFIGNQSVFGGTWNVLYTGNFDMASSSIAYIRNYNTGTSATSGIKITNTANTGGLLITETGSAYTATGTYGTVGANAAIIWNTENAPMVLGTNNNSVLTLGTAGEVTYSTLPTTDNTTYRVLAVNSSGVTKVVDNIVPFVSYSGTANSTTTNILDFTVIPNSSMVTIELQISFKQTSGTPSASAIYYKISRTFRRDSGGTVAAVAATTTLVSVNDTGDTFTVAPTIDVGGSSLNLVYNLSTAKTFSVEARQITTKL